jgi:hypothetical protein
MSSLAAAPINPVDGRLEPFIDPELFQHSGATYGFTGRTATSAAIHPGKPDTPVLGPGKSAEISF